MWTEVADVAVTSHMVAETGYFVDCMQLSYRNSK
jgi:hypothetical protein